MLARINRLKSVHKPSVNELLIDTVSRSHKNASNVFYIDGVQVIQAG